MNRIEKKKNFIITTVYTAIVIFIFYAFFKYAFGLVFPFLAALLIAMLLQRPLNFVCKKTPLKRGLVSVALVTLCFLVFIGILSLVIIWLGTELRDFFHYLMIQLEDIPAFIRSIEGTLSQGLSFLPDKLEETVTDFVSEKLAILLNSPDKPQNAQSNFDFSMLSGPLSTVWNTAKQIPVTLVAFIVSVIACCFMTADFATVKKCVLSLFHDETREKVIRTKKLLFPALGKMCKAYGLIITITFSELSAGLFLLSILKIYNGGYIFIIALITALIDIVPVLGTGTVLIPWALYCLLSGDYPLAIGIVIMYVCITVIRQIIEPKLVASQLGIPPFATIIAMYIGSRIFGFIGLFLLPITLVMVKMLNDEGIIHVFHHNESAKTIEAEQQSETVPESENEAGENE